MEILSNDAPAEEQIRNVFPPSILDLCVRVLAHGDNCLSPELDYADYLYVDTSPDVCSLCVLPVATTHRDYTPVAESAGVVWVWRVSGLGHSHTLRCNGWARCSAVFAVVQHPIGYGLYLAQHRGGCSYSLGHSLDHRSSNVVPANVPSVTDPRGSFNRRIKRLCPNVSTESETVHIPASPWITVLTTLARTLAFDLAVIFVDDLIRFFEPNRQDSTHYLLVGM